MVTYRVAKERFKLNDNEAELIQEAVDTAIYIADFLWALAKGKSPVHTVSALKMANNKMQVSIEQLIPTLNDKILRQKLSYLLLLCRNAAAALDYGAPWYRTSDPLQLNQRIYTVCRYFE